MLLHVTVVCHLLEIQFLENSLYHLVPCLSKSPSSTASIYWVLFTSLYNWHPLYASQAYTSTVVNQSFMHIKMTHPEEQTISFWLSKIFHIQNSCHTTIDQQTFEIKIRISSGLIGYKCGITFFIHYHFFTVQVWIYTFCCTLHK